MDDVPKEGSVQESNPDVLTPPYLTNIFKFSSEVHDRSLKSTQKIYYTCMSRNLILNFTETVLLIQDL